jgi:hypothetical protein
MIIPKSEEVAVLAERAILAALDVYRPKGFEVWAQMWLADFDRSVKSAAQARAVAWAHMIWIAAREGRQASLRAAAGCAACTCAMEVARWRGSPTLSGADLILFMEMQARRIASEAKI